MMTKSLRFGNCSVAVHDSRSSVKDRDWISSPPWNSEGYTYFCEVKAIEKLNGTLPAVVETLSRRGNFSGFHCDTFYSLMVDYGVVACSTIGTNRVSLYLSEQHPSKLSRYLINSIIRQHTHRHMFHDGIVPLHATGLIVGTSERVVLLFGPSGSGKSSLAWHLIQHNCILLSDDNIVSSLVGTVSGSGGKLVVRPDFLLQTGVNECTEIVSPGRKLALGVKSTTRTNALPFAIVGPSVVPNRDSHIGTEDLMALNSIITQAHVGWTFSQKERELLDCAIRELILMAPVRCIVQLGLNPSKVVVELLKLLEED